jgi:hypothetical protein
MPPTVPDPDRASRPPAAGLAARVAGSVALIAGWAALGWLTLHFVTQSGWLLAQVQAALPEGVALSAVRRCGGGFGLCALGVDGAVDGVSVEAGVAAVAFGGFPPAPRRVELHAASLSLDLGPRPAGEAERPPPPPPDLAAVARRLGELEGVRVRVGALRFDGAPVEVALGGVELKVSPRGAFTLEARSWDARGLDGDALGGVVAGATGSLDARGLSAELVVDGPRLGAALRLDLRQVPGAPPGLVFEASGSLALRGPPASPWSVAVNGLTLAPIPLGAPPRALDIGWTALELALPSPEVALAAGPGRLGVAFDGLLPRVDLEVGALSGGPLAVLAGVACARGDLGRLSLGLDTRLTGALEGLSLEGCALGDGPALALSADLLVDAGLVRLGLTGIVALEEGLLSGEVAVRRNPLGGRVSVAATGRGLLADGPVRAALLEGLSEALAVRAAAPQDPPSLDADDDGEPVEVGPGPLLLTEVEASFERDDGAVSVARDAVEVALGRGLRAVWDGLGWQVEGVP